MSYIRYINRLCQDGFCPEQATVRRLAYEFAVALKLDHKFNKEKKIAGYDWLWAFFRRHPELSILSIKKAQGLSLSRRKALTKDAAHHFYNLLDEEMKKYDLHDKPQNIYTNRKGDPLSIIVCCSAEGRFLPPTVIFKVKNLRPEFSDALPHGSNIYINSKSAYISSEIFLTWFTEHFLPQVAPGRNVLILNGHCSKVSSIALLELADKNNVSLLCLPPHATHALQPLGKSFFGPFKTYFKSVSTTWAEQHEGLKLSYSQVGSLICKAWTKSALIVNGRNGFKTTGIYPLNKDALPDCLFSTSDSRTDTNYLDNVFETDLTLAACNQSYLLVFMFRSKNGFQMEDFRPS
ncbi:conserved hypothetical protein [Pediculus humanus corporis]|uniref:DDE-1 domain-containing protein n=1 Tax=Pediculus humanus subsp. corporis TaxID=121224 RepID=E0VM43_PEDHC|nr:uncharacterized protein Phum_PHUM300640 [Pediculus humanus corporis]EEB14449.1 conserved hypothetical protein [Pediculus humanus corporis]